MNPKSFLVLLLALVSTARAATITWTNTAGGTWNQAVNWQPNQVPGAGDTALIISPGTYTVTLNANATVASLTLGGSTGTQTLSQAANTLTVSTGLVEANGVYAITAGALQGLLTIAPGGVLNLEGTTAKSVHQFTLVNNGTVNWNGGDLLGGNTPTTVITNNGLWVINSDNRLFQTIGGPNLRFANAGTLRKDAGSGVSAFSTVDFLNSGAVEVNSGTLRVNGNGSSAFGGTVTVAAGAAVDLNGGTFTDAGGVFTGPGTHRLTGGTLSLRTNILTGLSLDGGTVLTGPSFQEAGAITNLTLNGSQLDQTNRVGNGTLTLTAGALQGLLTIAPGGVLNLEGTTAKSVHQFTLVNNGTVNWNGGDLLGGNTPTTVITNNGLWVINSDNRLFQTIGGPNLRFANAGTLRKDAGSGVSALSTVDFLNSGAVEVNSGTLRVNGNGSSAFGGTVTVAAGAAVDLNGGTFTDAGGVFTGPGTHRLTGGTLSLRTNILTGLSLDGGTVLTGPSFQEAGAITNLTLNGSQLDQTNRVGNGTLTLTAGALQGLLTIAPGGVLNLEGTTAKSVHQFTLVNNGTVNWNGGDLLGGNTPTTVITNNGLWVINSDNRLFQTIGGPNLRFANAGTLRKDAGSGVSALSTVDFLNSGAVEVNSGTLRVNGNGSSAFGGTVTVAAGAAVDLNGGTFTDAGGVFTGPGTHRLTGGTLSLRTNILTGLSLDGGTVLTGPSFQEAGAITNLTLNGSQLDQTNRVGNGTLTLTAGALQGLLTIAPGGVLNLEGTTAKSVHQFTLVNNGTVNWNGGDLLGGNTPTTVITNNGLWVINSDNRLFQTIGGPNLRFANAGTLRKDAGSGVSALSTVDFLNSGAVEVNSGTLRVNGNGSSAFGGTVTVAAGAAVDLNGGTFTDAGGVFTGPGTHRLTGGTLSLRTNILTGLSLDGGTVLTGPSFQEAGAITNLTLNGSQLDQTNRVGNGTLTLTAGALQGLLTIAPGGVLNLEGTTAKSVHQFTLVNNGTVNWNGGDLLGGNTPTTVITNNGLWVINSDNRLFQTIGGPNLRFANAGTLRKDAGSGVSALSTVDFLNSGTVEVNAGTLRFPQDYVNTGGILRGGGGTIEAQGTLTLAGGTLEGRGTIGANALNSGTVSPGTNGTGILNFKSGLNLGTNVNLSMAVNGTTPGTEHDELTVTGTVTLANCLLQLTRVAAFPTGTKITLIDNDGTDPVNGTFQNLAEGALFPIDGHLYRIRYGGGTGNDVVLVSDDGTVQLASLPRLTNGLFQLRGLGTNYATYTIDATTNFTDWVTLGAATANAGGLFFFIDADTHLYPYRFYRSLGP